MENKPFRKHKPFQSKKNIIVGRNPIMEALKAGSNIDKIICNRMSTGETMNDIKELAREKGIPVHHVPNEKLNSLTNTQHQGIIAFKSAVTYQDLQQVIDWVIEKGETPLFIMMDGVTDIRNIGAIVRSAVCCGAQAIIIPEKGVGALNEDAVKSSAGAFEHIQICREMSLPHAIDTLHLNGLKVYSSEMKAPKKVFEVDLTEPCCIVMGGEDKGIQQHIVKTSDEVFSIPMKNNFDSLNVSVAAGIILYEALRQRD